MARPPLLVRPLAALAAGLLVAALVQAAPAAADEPTVTAALSVAVSAHGLPGGTEDAPADLGPAPGSATLDIRVGNDGPEDVQGLVVTSSTSGANGTVSAPECDLTGLPAVDGGGPTLPAGQSVTCSATVSGVAAGSVHESAVTASGTVGDPASPVSVETPFFATASAPITLGDRVWRDTDRDGVQDDGEPGLPGVRLTLTGGTVATAQQTTGTDGAFSFTHLPALPVGTRYTVTVDPASSALAGLSATTTTSRKSADGLLPGQSDLSLDFGFAPPTPPAPAPVKATVRLSADAAPEPAITGSTITVKGLITRAGKAFATSVALERQMDGASGWAKVKTVRSSKKGALSTTVKADRSASYRYRFAGDSTTNQGASAGDHVVVRKAKVKLTVSAPGSVTKGKSIKVKGSIRREGKKYRTTTVLEFRAGGGWSRVKTVRSSSKGALSTSVKPSRSGEYRYRFAGNTTTASATSRGDHVTVKPKPPARPKPKAYANCTALNRVYPHGVGRSGAKDKVRGSTDPVTDFVRDTATYKKNTKSDRDRDGIACEKP